MRTRTEFMWFPNPNAWMSAVFLFLLTGGLAISIKTLWQLTCSVSSMSPRLGILLGGLVLLLPIVLIAIAHHALHLFLDYFFPDTRSAEMGEVSGFIPSIMSWWEGLYGWLVLILSTLTSGSVLGFLFYSPAYLTSLYLMLDSWDKTKHLLTIPTIIWLIVAAYLYQFESVVRHHLTVTTQR